MFLYVLLRNNFMETLFESGVSDNKQYISEASSETESLLSLRFWPFMSLISILP